MCGVGCVRVPGRISHARCASHHRLDADGPRAGDLRFGTAWTTVTTAWTTVTGGYAERDISGRWSSRNRSGRRRPEADGSRDGNGTRRQPFPAATLRSSGRGHRLMTVAMIELIRMRSRHAGGSAGCRQWAPIRYLPHRLQGAALGLVAGRACHARCTRRHEPVRRPGSVLQHGGQRVRRAVAAGGAPRRDACRGTGAGPGWRP